MFLSKTKLLEPELGSKWDDVGWEGRAEKMARLFLYGMSLTPAQDQSQTLSLSLVSLDVST